MPPCRRDRKPAGADADGHPDAYLLHEEDGGVACVVVWGLDQFDHDKQKQDRDRVVESSLSLERAAQPRRQTRTAQERKDRCAVGRGEDRTQQQALEQREVKQPGRRRASDERGDDRACDRQPQGASQDRPDLAPAGRKSTVEQDQTSAIVPISRASR